MLINHSLVATARAESRPIRRRPSATQFREKFASTAFLIPIALVFIVLIAAPFVQSVYYSFTNFTGFNPNPDFVGFENYARVFSDSSLLSGLIFTLVFAVVTTALVTALAIPLAVVLNQKFVGKRFVRAVFFFPAIPSIAILGLVWNFILSPLGSGALNSVLGSLFAADPVPWLANATLSQISVIVVGIWSTTGWHAILYLAYLQSIPKDYYEVATIDGAGPLKRFLYITLPLLTPAVTVSTLLLMTSGLNVFALPDTLTGGGPGYATYTITQSILTSGISQAKYGQGSALAVVFMIAVGIIVIAQLQLSRRLERNAS